MTEVRKYESPLRAAQAEETRRRLLEAAAALMAGNADEMTVREAARRAGVSAPTAYRYFPTREDLVDAVGDWVNEQVGFDHYPETVDEAFAFAGVLFPGFERNDTLLRAQLAHPSGREVRARNLVHRLRAIEDSVGATLPGAPPETVRRYSALVHLLLSSSAWLHLHDHWGFDSAEAAQVSTWALRALDAAVRADPDALVTEESR